MRWPLFIRCVFGSIGFACFTFGAVLVPITIQLTIGNLAPFFAGLLAYIVVGERMSFFEIISMVISFGAIVLIAFGQDSKVDESGDSYYFAENLKLGGIIGCFLMIVSSISSGALALLTRIMQAISVSCMMVYIAVFSVFYFSIFLLVENSISEGPLRILSYSGNQYLWGFGLGAINVVALFFKIIAFQNEKSGLITLLG